MSKDNRALIGRSVELKELTDFATMKKAGFVYVRGRRRVGKSTLLKELHRTRPHVFYFFGADDSTVRGLLDSFADQWDQFTGKVRLTELKKLSWSRVFSEVSEYARAARSARQGSLPRPSGLVLVFDEIQWIAKAKSGCAGAIKEAWLDWERLGVKVIICGSSNKFFLQKTGGEETILRGLKTRSDIWISPFSLGQVKRFYFPKWKNEEVALTYMMFGGVPYYLNRIEDPDRGFIQCINDAVFKHDTIFLEEVDEVLRLEFNEHGLRTAKMVLSCLGLDGTTQAEIQRTTGLALTTVARALESLLDYGIVFQKSPAHAKRQNDAGMRFFMKDFYLNFYFQVLLSYKSKIESNKAKGLLFPQVLGNSNAHYFIQNFSGKAFELLVRYVLERRVPPDPALHRIFHLRDYEYEVLFYWDKETEIDILLESQTDRIARIIECKWVGVANDEGGRYLKEVVGKKYIPPSAYSVLRFLCVSKPLSAQFVASAKEEGVEVVGLESLFADE